jgi:hypothetical protein
VAVLALVSAANSGPDVWRALGDLRETYAPYTEADREHAPITELGLPADVFDFYRDRVRRGDRMYFQVQEGILGQFFDQPTAFAFAARFYLLPAGQARDLDDATVVLTLIDDPARLGVPFLLQQQAGEQPIFVSRIRMP